MNVKKNDPAKVLTANLPVDFNKKFTEVADSSTIARLFTAADEDLMEYAKDVSYGYRETIHKAYTIKDQVANGSWYGIYDKIQGFHIKLRGKKKAEFITVGIKNNATSGVFSPLSKDNAEIYEAIKPGGLNVEQIYIDLREAFTIIRTAKSWVCLYQTPGKVNFACIINRDMYPNLSIVDALLFTRSQPGIKNYGFTE